MSSMHSSIRQNLTINDLLLEAFAEDKKAKDEEARTFTINKASIAQEENQSIDSKVNLRERLMTSCSRLAKFDIVKVIQHMNDYLHVC